MRIIAGTACLQLGPASGSSLASLKHGPALQLSAERKNRVRRAEAIIGFKLFVLNFLITLIIYFDKPIFDWLMFRFFVFAFNNFKH